MHLSLSGQIYEGQKSKYLVKNLPKHAIALLWHEDIDPLTTEALLSIKVKAIVNRKQSMSGRYAHEEVRRLIRAGIHVFDVQTWYGPDEPLKGENVQIMGGDLYISRDDTLILIAELVPYDENLLEERSQMARSSYSEIWSSFIKNTLTQAENERDNFLTNTHVPRCMQKANNRYVLIVARNGTYKQDLQALRRWLFLMNPVLVAVDGAADGMLALGLKPDIIVGDMDSISNHALQSGADVICHTYADGSSPGRERLDTLNISAEQVAFKGTSEDVAIMTAFWAEAEHIFLIGCRMGIKEFLEKDRQGMASSMLARIQTGDKLTDLKGSHHLFTRSSLTASVQQFGQELQEEWSELKQLVSKGYRLLIRKEVMRHD